MPRWDPVELRQRIVVCFTARDLRRVAEELSAEHAATWDRGTQQAAHELVRHFEREGGLDRLVDALRRARPLVEWPEPMDESAPEPRAETASAPASPPPASDAEGALGPAGRRADAFGQAPPLASPGMLVGAHAPAAPATATAQATSGSPTTAAAAPGWPGVIAPPPEAGRLGAGERRGLDPRILVLVGVLTLGAAVVAWFAGRASTAAGSSPEAAASSAAAPATAEASAPRPKRPDGLATRAAETLSRKLAEVARVCELPRTAAPGDILRSALEQCGPRAAPVQPNVPIPPEPPPLEPAPAADDPTRPVVVPKDPGLPKAPGSACLAACEASHRGCKAKCGPEPTSSNDYGEHQVCLARCLSAASKCRLGCQ